MEGPHPPNHIVGGGSGDRADTNPEGIPATEFPDDPNTGFAPVPQAGPAPANYAGQPPRRSPTRRNARSGG